MVLAIGTDRRQQVLTQWCRYLSPLHRLLRLVIQRQHAVTRIDFN
ncbi:MAG: hypothetical protein WCG81_18370 [Candidatus Angelobacter sp.]